MTTDFRALCAELVLQMAVMDDSRHWDDSLYDHACAELAKPEPVADLAAKLLAESKPMDPEMAAVLTTEARWDLYEGSPTPQPEPVAPTDEELLELLSRVSGLLDYDAYTVDGGRIMSEPNELLAYARAVLARWGRPAIEPVPVSERLPGPEDCDGDGRCWIFMPDIGTDPSWRLTDPRDIGPYHTHWLPHHALPTPEANS
jgi:hypothetical protein